MDLLLSLWTLYMQTCLHCSLCILFLNIISIFLCVNPFFYSSFLPLSYLIISNYSAKFLSINLFFSYLSFFDPLYRSLLPLSLMFPLVFILKHKYSLFRNLKVIFTPVFSNLVLSLPDVQIIIL